MCHRCETRASLPLGWIKMQAGMAKIRLRGTAKVDAAFVLTLTRLQSD
jgi:hypothetical protein